MLRRHKPTSIEAFPGYSELHEIGSGTFATVYRAVEVDTARLVALKVLKVDTVALHLVEAFDREVRALGSVSEHPHVVTLHRTLTAAGGRPVLVLELCRESLAQRLRRDGPVPAQQVVATGVKVAGALETAHRCGFLHRDMKPQNVLVTTFGEPALADFGVAALQASAHAAEGVLGFTTVHAAPEMLEGKELSPATDVYGLASTLYHLLAGQAPFGAFASEAPAPVMLRILRDPVRPLRSADVPLALSDLLEAALAKRPEDRPQSAAALAEALRQIEASSGWTSTPCVVRGGSPSAGLAVGIAAPGPSGLAVVAARPEGVVAGVAPVPPASVTLPASAGGPSVLLPGTGGRNVVRPVAALAARRVLQPDRRADLAPLAQTGEGTAKRSRRQEDRR